MVGAFEMCGCSWIYGVDGGYLLRGKSVFGIGFCGWTCLDEGMVVMVGMSGILGVKNGGCVLVGTLEGD